MTKLEAQVDQRGFLQTEIDAKSLVQERQPRWGSRLNHLGGRNPRGKRPHLAGPKLNSPKIFIFGKKVTRLTTETHLHPYSGNSILKVLTSESLTR